MVKYIYLNDENDKYRCKIEYFGEGYVLNIEKFFIKLFGKKYYKNTNNINILYENKKQKSKIHYIKVGDDIYSIYDGYVYKNINADVIKNHAIKLLNKVMPKEPEITPIKNYLEEL